MGEPGFFTLLVALAGGVGAAVRYLVDGAIMLWAARNERRASFPYGTWFVNLSGSMLIGVLAGAGSPWQPIVTLLGVGLLGGYTTFSAASYQSVQLLRRGRVWASLANGPGQLFLAVAAAAAGFGLGALVAF